MIDTSASPIAPTSREQTSTPRRGPILALFAANGISRIGNNVTNLAIPWFVYSTTGSAAQTGLVAFFSLLPTMLAMLFGGALADRIGHKRTSILGDLLSGVTVAAVPLLYHTFGLPFPVLLVLVFFGALFDAPGAAARGAMIAPVAEMAQMPLERVNSWFQAIGSAAGLIGPPLAGLGIVLLGESNVLWFDAATFAVSAVTIALFVPAVKLASGPEQTYLADVLAGIRFLLGNRLLRTIAWIATVINLLLAPLFGVIMPVFAKEQYDSASAFGIVIAGEGAGSLIGSLLFAAIGHRLPRRPTFVGAFALASVSLGLIAMTPSLWVTTLSMTLFGFWISPLNPLVETVLQERVPPHLRARVFGAIVASALLAAPLGVLIAGGIVAAIGVPSVVMGITGGLLLLAGIMLRSPALHDLGRPAAGRAPAVGGE